MDCMSCIAAEPWSRHSLLRHDRSRECCHIFGEYRASSYAGLRVRTSVAGAYLCIRACTLGSAVTGIACFLSILPSQAPQNLTWAPGCLVTAVWSMLQKSGQPRSENSPQVPRPHYSQLCCHESCERGDVDKASHGYEAIELSTVDSEDLTRDGDADESRGGDDGIAGGIVAAVFLRLAQAANGHRDQADVAAGAEAEQQHEDDDAGGGVAGGQPDAQAGQHGQADGVDAGVEGAYQVGGETAEHAAEEGAGIEQGQQVGGEGLAEALAERVRGDVGQGDEDGELEQEHGGRGQGEGAVQKNARVRAGAGAAGGRQPRADQQVGHDGGGQADEAEGADGPSPAGAVEQRLQDQREQHAAHGAGRRDDARGETPARQEEVAHGGDGGREQEGAGNADEQAEDEQEMPVL